MTVSAFVRRARRWAYVPLLLVLGGLAATLPSHLQSGGFTNSSMPSSRAAAQLTSSYGVREPDFTVVLRNSDGSADALQPVAGMVAGALRQWSTGPVTSYWTTHSPALLSRDRRAGLIVTRLAAGTASDTRVDAAEKAVRHAVGSTSVSIRFAGAAAVSSEVDRLAKRGLMVGEMLAIPLTALVLLLVFGSIRAAVVPLVVGVACVVMTLALLHVLVLLTTVSIYAVDLATAMSFGLAVDYSLIVVSRARRERAAGQSTEEALRRAVATAGHTAAVSAVTVGACLAALLAVPVPFVRSYAYAGTSVAASMLLTVRVLLPRLLARLPRAIDSDGVWWLSTGFHNAQLTAWRRVGASVVRRPLAAGVLALGVLVLLAVPIRGATFGLVSERILPSGNAVRTAVQEVANQFPLASDPYYVVLQDSPHSAAQVASDVSRLPAVAAVLAGGSIPYVNGTAVTVPRSRSAAGADGWLLVAPSHPHDVADGVRIVRSVQSLAGPRSLVDGGAAQYLDIRHGISDSLPTVVLILVCTELLLLAVYTRSVILPIKALAINVLGALATLGAVTYVFGEGHLATVLGFHSLGYLDLATPILLVCAVFAISMDYEIFVLAAVLERRRAGAQTQRAVALGLADAGPVISAAALTAAVAFASFGVSGIVLVKEIGATLAFAVLLDATVVRALLVPSAVVLAGEANWWWPVRSRASLSFRTQPEGSNLH